MTCACPGCQLAVRSMASGSGAQGRAAEALLEYQFLPRRWYHVAVSHSAGSALAPAWVRLYVNGGLEAHERLKYPKARDVLSAGTGLIAM